MKQFGEVIECSDLEPARDIPEELTQLCNENTSLHRSNELLKAALVLLGAGIAVYVIYEIIQLIKRKNDEEENEQEYK